MQIASLINSALPVRAEEMVGALRAWAKGQVLDASVLRAGNGQALLQVNGQQVLAQTRMPLIVGQVLRLQVDQAGTQPQLRVLNSPANSTGNSPGNAAGTAQASAAANGKGASSAAVLQIINQNMAPARLGAASPAPGTPMANASNEALAAALLRSALPQRQLLPQSMTALEQFAAAPRSANTHPALQQARAMVADMLQGLPRPEDAGDANRLRAMVQRSGLFHEAELAQHGQDARRGGDDSAHALSRQHLLHPPAADMKARLMAVAESLANAMRAGAVVDRGSEQAALALRGALSNIEANQVASVRGSEHHQTQGAVWRVDVPIADARGHQALQLRIEREPRGRAEEALEPSWIAQVTIQVPGGAPLHARIALTGDTVYTTFRTDDEALVQQIEGGEPQLRQLLDAVHLGLGGMNCQRAVVGDMAEELPASGLLSEHA